jgi:hypothetical protein
VLDSCLILIVTIHKTKLKHNKYIANSPYLSFLFVIYNIKRTIEVNKNSVEQPHAVFEELHFIVLYRIIIVDRLHNFYSILKLKLFFVVILIRKKKMDKSDFTFMKTGFGNFQDSESMEKNIIGTLVLFTENAMKSAGFYTKHCKRKNITKEDIKRCLMFEVFLFCCRENLQENIENVIGELYNEENEENEENEDDEENEIVFEEDIENSFKISDCKCGICQTLNNIHEKWSSWKPETPIQEIIQKHINNI